MGLLLMAIAFAPWLPAAKLFSVELPLLERLRMERQIAVSEATRVQAGKPKIDLKPLLGVGRHDVLQFLGAPNLCAIPEDAGCTHSTRIVYFFYPNRPSTAKDTGQGLVEVTVTAGGGWALEINLEHDSVAGASWVKQE